MLGTTVWLVVVIGLLAVALMNGAAAFGRAGVQAAADHAIDAAMHDAVAEYQNRLQTAAEHAQPQASPLEGTVAGDAGAPGTPAFTLAYSVTPTTLAAPDCSQTAGPSTGPDTIAWLQCGGFVRESRMSLRVVVRVLDATGTETLAQREQFVTLRLFGEPPYSAVVGRKDASAGDPAASGALAAPAHEGDVGGDTVSGISPAPEASAGPSAWPAGGTLIHVRYECRDGAGRCANAAPPDPDAGLRAGTHWANGNRPKM
ncbi:MAG: hypothetical protein QOF71_2282 [Candidatus Eremiobacteraeota bacterium]|nr:hypothetical protein [Candidatus Eremiobacteraeota bacterium]